MFVGLATNSLLLNFRIEFLNLLIYFNPVFLIFPSILRVPRSNSSANTERCCVAHSPSHVQPQNRFLHTRHTTIRFPGLSVRMNELKHGIGMLETSLTSEPPFWETFEQISIDNFPIYALGKEISKKDGEFSTF